MQTLIFLGTRGTRPLPNVSKAEPLILVDDEKFKSRDGMVPAVPHHRCAGPALPKLLPSPINESLINLPSSQNPLNQL